MPHLGLSALPLAFASLLIAFPTRHKHQPYHADCKEGDRAIIYLTNALSKDSGIVQFKDKKVMGRAGTGVFYKASTVHRGRANRSGKVRVALALAYSWVRVTTVGIGPADGFSATFSADYRTVTGTFTYNTNATPNFTRYDFWQTNTSNAEQIFAQTLNSPLLHDSVNFLGTIQNTGGENPSDVVFTFAVAHIASINIDIYEGAALRFSQYYSGSPLSGANISIVGGIATVTTSTGAIYPGAGYVMDITAFFTDGSGIEYTLQGIDPANIYSAVQLSTFQTARRLKYTLPGSMAYTTTFDQTLAHPDSNFKFVFNFKTSTENFYGPYIQNKGSMRQTALANIYGRLGVVETSLTTGSFTTSFTNLESSIAGYGTSIGNLETTASSFSTLLDTHITSLSGISGSLSIFSGSFSSITTIINGGGAVGGASEAYSFHLGGVAGYNEKILDPLFPAQPIPYVGQSFASSSLFRPYQLNLNADHFLSTSAYFKNNALMITSPIPSDSSPGQLSNSNYVVVDQTKVPLTRGKTLRVYNAQEVIPYQLATYTLMGAQPFFSYTGCSYSANDSPNNVGGITARHFSNSCGALAASLSNDSSTVYVYGSYVSETTNSTLLYWAQLPKTVGQLFSPQFYQPEQMTYMKSDTLLSLSTPLDYANTMQKFVPLIPGEDWYAIAAAGSVTQHTSASGFGSWPTVQYPLGGNYTSFTSLTFIGMYDTLNSYSHFDPKRGSFFYRGNNGSFTGSTNTDNLFFCASEPGGSGINLSCSAIAALTGAQGYVTFTVDLSSIDATTLHSQYGLVRGADAWSSITELLSISTANNVFSITRGPNASNTTTPIYDSLVRGSLLKGVTISDVQPQENLSLVYNASNTYWSSSPYYWKIPSVLNPSNIQFNPIFSTTILSSVSVFLPGSATAAAGGFVNRVRSNLDPTLFTTGPPPTISFQFGSPFNGYSFSENVVLSTQSVGPYAVNFNATPFGGGLPSYYVDFYFPSYYTQINVSYSTLTATIGGGGGGPM
jgi:hypothetical protein